MGLEIERKFLVRNDGYRAGADSRAVRQGYLGLDPERTVRVRLSGGRGWLTIKGRAQGPARAEYEYEIPAADAGELLSLCDGAIIEKTRHVVSWRGTVWEVDEFAGENAGLVVAECELEAVDQDLARPDWLGDEVTDDRRYSNSALARHPYTRW